MTTHALFGLLILLLAAVALFVQGLRAHRRTTFPQIQQASLFTGLTDAVGRAAEEGTLIHVTLGSGALWKEHAVTSIAALESLTGLADLSAAYDTPPIVTTGDPTLYLLADDWMRRAYARVGNVARYRPTLVQFLAPSPVVYGAMASIYLYERGVGSNLMLGLFDVEATFLGDVAARRGTPIQASTTSTLGLAALFPTLDREDLMMGEEHFLGGAVATQRPAYWGALQAQDMLRWAVAGGIVIVAVLTALGMGVS
ncbi:MAG: DUF6754 domain-containing protein [Anaerolineae bacterium]